jgi:glycosyltransferase 2 family protein
MSSKSNSPWRDVRSWLPGLLISVVALLFVLKFINWEEFSLALTAMRPANLMLAIVLVLAALVTRSLCWRTLMGLKTSLRDTFFILNIGYLLNTIFPLRAGEAGRAILMGRKTGLGTFYILSTIIIERAYDLAIAAGMLLSTLPFVLGMDWARSVAYITLSMVISGLATLFIIARNRDRVKIWLEKLGKRWPIFNRLAIPKTETLIDGLGALTQPKLFFLSVFWIAMSWLLYVITYFVLLLPIAPQSPFWWALFGNSAVAFGVAIPSAPAGIGVWEASTVGALSLLGIAPSASLAFALLHHLIGIAISGVLGLVGLLREGRSISALLREIRGREAVSIKG